MKKSVIRKHRRISVKTVLIMILTTTVVANSACTRGWEDDMSNGSRFSGVSETSDIIAVSSDPDGSSDPDNSSSDISFENSTISSESLSEELSGESGNSTASGPTAGPTTGPTATPTVTASSTPAATPTGSTGAEKLTGSIPLISDNILLLGRIIRTDSYIGIDWSCSGIELNVRGGKVELTMDAVDTSDRDCTHIGVYIDGVRTRKIRLQTGNIKYLIAEGLSSDKVTNVKIMKLNEVSTSQFKVTGIEITGILQKDPALKTRKIEFVGDSITTGYGNLCTSPADPFLSETQDGTLAYPGLVAEELDASYNVVAAGGHGVYVQPKLPYKYVRTSAVRDFKAMWDFSRFRADVIVINLGTNDIAQAMTKTNLDMAITDFLALVRSNNPNARIIWAYGLMYNINSSWIKESVENFAENDPKVHYFQLTLQNIPANGTGSSSHPNTVSHQIAANELATFIRDIMDWN